MSMKLFNISKMKKTILIILLSTIITLFITLMVFEIKAQKNQIREF